MRPEPRTICDRRVGARRRTVVASALTVALGILGCVPAYADPGQNADKLAPTASMEVDAGDDTVVSANQTLTYRLIFDNTAGSAAAVVDYANDLSGLVDDTQHPDQAAILAAQGLTVELTEMTLAITGEVAAGQRSEVTYQVVVKPDYYRGDSILINRLAPAGNPSSTEDPSRCAADPLCTVNQVPELTLTKTTNVAKVSHAGDMIDYRFAVKNSGGITVESVRVDDPLLESVVCGVRVLEPGASTDCDSTYAVTQADIDAGHVLNTASATGATPVGEDASPGVDVVSNQAVAQVQVVYEDYALVLMKLADMTQATSAGQEIAYRFIVTNVGDQSVDGLRVTDHWLEAGHGTMSAVTCPTTALDPGESVICVSTYTVSGQDLSSQTLRNVATASAVVAGNSSLTVSSPPSQATVPVNSSGAAVSTGGSVLFPDEGPLGALPWGVVLLACAGVALVGHGVKMTVLRS